jgi:hypothetical protein
LEVAKAYGLMDDYAKAVLTGRVADYEIILEKAENKIFDPAYYQRLED